MVHRAMFSHRAISRRAHKPVSFLILSAALFLILYSDLAVSRANPRSLSFGEEPILRDSPIVRPNLGRLQLRSVHEAGSLEELSDSPEKLGPLIPPVNTTEEERIAWFREKLPEFDIFRSDNSTSRFQTRVGDFLRSGCSLRFFMTWILPASLFGGRELLAVESLFRAHPDSCLVIVSRTLDTRRGQRILGPILSRGEFKLLAVTPDLDSLFARTPAEAWYDEVKTANRDPGEIPLAQNLSNLIRLAILYKYGGVYLDTDFIVLKDFSRLRNSIGAQSTDPVSGDWTRINNAVLVFDAHHPLLFKFIQEFALTFDGNKWGHNGPYLVSRVVRRLHGREGYNFTVLPPMAFYPVDWTRIGGFLKKPKQISERGWVEAKLLQLSENTYGVHLWNKQSRGMEIEEGSIVGRLTSDHCIICRNTYSS